MEVSNISIPLIIALFAFAMPFASVGRNSVSSIGQNQSLTSLLN